MHKLAGIFLLPDLRQRIGSAVALLAACRIGAYIPVPGIDTAAAAAFFHSTTAKTGNLFQLMDMFSGGAFAQMTLFALGVMPNISASIIMQLMIALLPTLQQEMQENPIAATQRVARWTRLLTVVLSLFQSALYARYVLRLSAGAPNIVIPEISQVVAYDIPWLFYAVVMLTMTTGTLILVWIGEKISDQEVGNGMSLIITLGILSSMPRVLTSILRQLRLDSQEAGHLSLAAVAVLLTIFVAIIVATTLIVRGERKIPLQYARQLVGRQALQRKSSYIPLKINYAGVSPVIFATSVLMFPIAVGQLMGAESRAGRWLTLLHLGGGVYQLLHVLLIIFFTYFWTTTQFHPEKIASEMKKHGAFIPSVRQGKPTRDFLAAAMQRVTCIGALSLALITLLPTFISRLLRVDTTISHFFGGTSLLILVGVVLDTIQKIESHLLSSRYRGFMKLRKSRLA